MSEYHNKCNCLVSQVIIHHDNLVLTNYAGHRISLNIKSKIQRYSIAINSQEASTSSQHSRWCRVGIKNSWEADRNVFPRREFFYI